MTTPPSQRQVALITGASSGIGWALADVFSANGFDLVLVARNLQKLDELATRLRERDRVQVDVIPADLSQPGAARAVYEEVSKRSLRVDALVNNAGVLVYGEFSQTNLEDELRMIQLNLVALTELTKLFLPGMLARRRGWVLNLGSNGSFAPAPLNAIYAATKAYVLSFSEAIAEELSSSGVKVTALCPGATRAELQSRAGMPQVRLLRRGLMDPMDVARAGYRALMAGRPVETPGFTNWLEINMARFLPRRLVVRYARRYLEE